MGRYMTSSVRVLEALLACRHAPGALLLSAPEVRVLVVAVDVDLTKAKVGSAVRRQPAIRLAVRPKATAALIRAR